MKIGDKVVCINNLEFKNSLTIGKEYYINDYDFLSSHKLQIRIYTDDSNNWWFYTDNFISINDRRLKILKIKKRIYEHI
jgi:hypothetical protein